MKLFNDGRNSPDANEFKSVKETNEDDSDVDEDDTGDKSDSTDTELKKRKKLLSSKRFSGVDKKLEKLHDDLLTSAGQTPVLNQFDSTGDSAEWIRLSGATADINHMSAWAMTNVDLTHILKRGQRIRIGPKRFLINQDGDFSDAGERVFSDNGTSAVSGTISIYLLP